MESDRLYDLRISGGFEQDPLDLYINRTTELRKIADTCFTYNEVG